MLNDRLVFVTGGTGFIGKHLVCHFANLGYGVAVATRRPNELFGGPSCANAVTLVDAEDASSYITSKMPHLVVHLATDYGRQSSESVRSANVEWPRTLLKAAAGYGATFINTDSFFSKECFAYSYLKDYIDSKKEFKRIGELESQNNKLRFFTMRLEHVYGEGDGDSKFIPMIIKKLKYGSDPINLTDGRQRRDFVYVKDVVEAYSIIARSHSQGSVKSQTFEVGTGHSAPLREIIEKIASIIGAKKSRLNFGTIEQKPDEIMDSYANNVSLLELGWAPSSIESETALRATVDSY